MKCSDNMIGLFQVGGDPVCMNENVALFLGFIIFLLVLAIVTRLEK